MSLKDIHVNILKALEKRKMTEKEILYYVSGSTSKHINELFTMGIVATVTYDVDKEPFYINCTNVPDIIKEYEYHRKGHNTLNDWGI